VKVGSIIRHAARKGGLTLDPDAFDVY